MARISPKSMFFHNRRYPFDGDSTEYFTWFKGFYLS